MAWPTEEEQQEKINKWNQWYPIGTKVISDIYPEEENLVTRTEAVLLFKHRLAVYLEGYNGYFDLEETHPINPAPEDTIFAKKEAPTQDTSSERTPEKKAVQSKTSVAEQQDSFGNVGLSERGVPISNAKEKAIPDDTLKSKRDVTEPKKPPAKKAATRKTGMGAKQVSTAKKTTSEKTSASKTTSNVKTAAQAKKTPAKKNQATASKRAAGKKVTQKT